MTYVKRHCGRSQEGYLKAVLTLSLWKKPQCAIVQVKAIEQFFSVVFIHQFQSNAKSQSFQILVTSRRG